MKTFFSPLPQHLCQLCGSGEVSLGGSTVGRSVACELGLGGTTQICMDQAAVRSLAARTGAGSAICFCNFYGKITAPGAIGSSYKGGYYTGAVASPANYYLVIAPNASGCAFCCYNACNTIDPLARSLTDGFANTYNALATAAYPAGNFTATRSINGFSDWYLPAISELSVLYTNKGSMPAGEGYHACTYWSSTERCLGPTVAEGCVINFNPGNGFGANKFNSYRVRALRRVPF